MRYYSRRTGLRAIVLGVSNREMPFDSPAIAGKGDCFEKTLVE